ncbi:hypothetical protein TIFTF001_004665 [Ficus carica]|uniref:Molybdate-anion transporter n=1 Tax=Ficus carica TaxID=3494 RepID=A0AA87ZW00_FICCA|nr:hypothetical protein TIFTF001_004665 [Ficus carica]
MAVVIESSVWEPSPWLFVLIFLACFFSFLLLHFFPKKNTSSGGGGGGKTPAIFDQGISSPSFVRFKMNFLLLYALASVMEGLEVAFGEFEFSHYGVSKEQILLSICVGYASSLFFGTFLGVFSDLIFETWMVVQHEKQGHRRDTLNDIFWLMSFYEAACLLQGQALSNWLIGDNVEKNISSPSMAAVFFAMLGIICIAKIWAEVPQKTSFKEYKMSFQTYIFGGTKHLSSLKLSALIGFSHSSHSPSLLASIKGSGYWHGRKLAFTFPLQSSGFFGPQQWWYVNHDNCLILALADGREVNLGLIYPFLVASRMLGSTIFPWLIGGVSSRRTEDYLVYAFGIMGLVLFITAYDYQEIGVLVTLFCLFHASIGFVLPSLARLRTTYVPNELRGGMTSLSQAPADMAILFFLLQRGYCQIIGNAGIMAIAALGLFTAAGCIHVLKWWGKQPYQNGHKS